MNLLAQIKADGHLLNRPAPPKKGGKRYLPKVSKRGAERKAAYKVVERAHLNEFPLCQVGEIIRANGFTVDCRGKAKHCHHRKGRVGPLLCDRRFLLSSCDGECHPPWVHVSHVKEAREIGLLLPH